jgi:hypothetical protein
MAAQRFQVGILREQDISRIMNEGDGLLVLGLVAFMRPDESAG